MTRRLVPALLLVAACSAAPPPTPSPTPLPSLPDGWARQHVDGTGVSLSVPPDWETYDDEALGSAATREDLEARYPGARGIFRAIAAQGDRVDLQLLTVDPTGQGGPAIPATVSVVEVEPRIPSVGLGVGVELVLDGLDAALDIQSEPATERIQTPVGDAVRFTFDHLVIDATTGESFIAEIEGALVTSDEGSFVVLRMTDAAVDDAGVPSLDEVLGTLREGSQGS